MKSPYDDIASLYNTLFDSMEVRKKEFTWLEKHADFSKSKTVLDIGCGNGILLRTIAGRIKKGIGIDLSSQMISYAKQNLSDHKNIFFKKVKDSTIPLPENSADIIVSFYSFRYLKTDTVLKEIMRVIKPDGRLIIADMFINTVSIKNLFPLLKDKFRHSVYLLFHPEKNKKLKTLVRHPAWKTMLKEHPLKSLDVFKQKITNTFLFPEFFRLDTGFHAQTAGFCSQIPILFSHYKNKQLPRMCIMDWGIGGMGFYSMFKKENPDIPVVYLSDTGFIPYGKASKKQLLKRLETITVFCEYNNITHLVIACNAMSSVLDSFNKKTAVRITGVIKPAVEYINKTSYKTIGIIGGKRTIQSHAYKKGIGSLDKNIIQRAAQPLSAFIESGDIQSRTFSNALKNILSSVKHSEALVLACTHYIAAEKQIREQTDAKIIDPVPLLMEWVNTHWKIPKSGMINDMFITTGDPDKMKQTAHSMFSVKIKNVYKTGLPA